MGDYRIIKYKTINIGTSPNFLIYVLVYHIGLVYIFKPDIGGLILISQLQ